MAIESKMKKGPIGHSKKGGNGNSGMILGVIVLVAVLVFGWWAFFRSTPERPVTTVITDDGEEIQITSSTDAYQAVFLDNGQVYFGKLDITTHPFYLLSDVYYLQSGVSVDTTANISLIKLGNEAHGPEDFMQLNPDHVLFFEDMKSDSKVMQAIYQYKGSN
jgi:hypothetical protein